MVCKPFGSRTCLDTMVREPFGSQTLQIRGHGIVLNSKGSKIWLDAMVRKPFGSRTLQIRGHGIILHHPRVPDPWRCPGPAVLLPGTPTVLTRYVLPHVANVKSHIILSMTTGHSQSTATLLILGCLLMNF